MNLNLDSRITHLILFRDVPVFEALQCISNCGKSKCESLDMKIDNTRADIEKGITQKLLGIRTLTDEIGIENANLPLFLYWKSYIF